LVQKTRNKIDHKNFIFVTIYIKGISQIFAVHNMNVSGEVKVQLHSFITSALDRNDWSAFRPRKGDASID